MYKTVINKIITVKTPVHFFKNNNIYSYYKYILVVTTKKQFTLLFCCIQPSYFFPCGFKNRVNLQRVVNEL